LPAVSIAVADRVEDYAGQALAVIEKTRELTRHLTTLAAIELIVAAQAVDLRGTLRLGEGSEAIYRTVRSQVARLDRDRPTAWDVEALLALIETQGIT